MKKWTKRLALLAVVVSGIVIIIVSFLPADPQLLLTLACVYIAMVFGMIGWVQKNPKMGIILAFNGLVLIAFGVDQATALCMGSAIAMIRRKASDSEMESDENDEPGFALPNQCGLLIKNSNGDYFQVFRGRDQLFVVSLGSRFLGLTPERAIRSEDEFTRAEGDRSIPLYDIRSIGLKQDGRLRIRVHRFKRGISAKAYMSASDIAAYFSGLPYEADVRNETIPASEEQRTALNNVLFAIAVLGGLCAATWIIFDVPYKIFAVLNLMILAITIVLDCRLHNDVTKTKKTDNFLNYSITFTSIALIIHLINHFNFVSLVQFILPTVILAAGVIMILFALNPRVKPGQFMDLPSVLFSFPSSP